MGHFWRRALGRRVLREALIDELWPWLSGGELMWRTGLFELGFMGILVHMHMSGSTAQKAAGKRYTSLEKSAG